MSNPDQLSERQILTQLAPNLDNDLIFRLVAAFHDLRAEYDKGFLSYPYSLRELINLVKHLDRFPDDTLAESLRNVFDFDVHRPETIDRLARILEQHGFVFFFNCLKINLTFIFQSARATFRLGSC